MRFFLLTKRPERVAQHLPWYWGDGWDHVMLNVSCENQRRADERVPVLLELPFKHKGVMCAPLIGPVSLEAHLASGRIEQVLADGESYAGSRPCRFEWVRGLRDACERHDVTFVFLGTGRVFVKDGRTYHLEGDLQSTQAHKSQMSYQGAPVDVRLTDEWGRELEEEDLYHPFFGPKCATCGMRPVCNGCTRCGRCRQA